MRVDVFEELDELVVEVELPGVQLGEVEVGVDPNVLHIRGVRDPSGDRRYFRQERGAGPFARSVPLPRPVRVDAVHATLHNGLLAVRLGVDEEASALLGYRVLLKGDEPCRLATRGVVPLT